MIRLSDLLLQSTSPWVMACQMEDLEYGEVSSNDPRFMQTVINGTECRSIEDFYAKIKKEFSFPDYFGENLSALTECMDEFLSKDRRPFALVVDNAGELFVGAHVSSLHGLLSTFSLIGKRWSSGIDDGDGWTFPPRRFLVVLAYE